MQTNKIKAAVSKENKKQIMEQRDSFALFFRVVPMPLGFVLDFFNFCFSVQIFQLNCAVVELTSAM